MTDEDRLRVIETARAWLRTPYHPHAAVKGAGADCAMFPLAVYRECGMIPADYKPPRYSPQWHLHHTEELYIAEVEKFCREKILTPNAGDFVLFRIGRAYSHGAIVIDWPVVIHSYIPHGVQITDVHKDGAFHGRKWKCFELMPENSLT